MNSISAKYCRSLLVLTIAAFWPLLESSLPVHSGTCRFEMEPFHAVWGSSRDNVFMVGRRGAIRHYDGQHFRDMSSGLPLSSLREDFRLRGVWGSAADDVFAVGSSGNNVYITGNPIPHYDGFDWTTEQPAEAIEITYRVYRSIWGSSPNNVFVGAKDRRVRGLLTTLMEGMWSAVGPIPATRDCCKVVHGWLS